MTANDQRTVMYNERGEIVGDAGNNEGEQRSHNPQMDLSTSGSIKKKDAELDAIRATGRQRKGVKDRIYDSSGRLNAWTELNEKDEIAEQNDQDMDLSAEGMKLKKVSTFDQMY